MARNRVARGSLTRQVQEAYDAKLKIGQSKYQAKVAGTARDGIYSWSTYRSYLKHANYFVKFCKTQHGCSTLDQCRQYVDEWLKSRSELSPYTQKLEAAALGKLYGCSTTEFVKTGTRFRANITRSRGVAIRDAHFSEARHQNFVEFCRSTGLRRSELQALRGDQLIYRDGAAYLAVVGKGGRYREAPVIGNVANVERLCSAAGSGYVFGTGRPGGKLPGNADIHGYRAEYATEIYRAAARPIDQIPYDRQNRGSGRLYQSQVYCCRGDLAGVKLDREAMREASVALGHNRVSVVAGHYIRL